MVNTIPHTIYKEPVDWLRTTRRTSRSYKTMNDDSLSVIPVKSFRNFLKGVRLGAEHQNKRIKELETKLEKAVKALRIISNNQAGQEDLYKSLNMNTVPMNFCRRGDE